MMFLSDPFYLSVFPALAKKPAMYLNMDEFYASGMPLKDGKSVFLIPSLTDRFLNALHRVEGAAYSFGGYLEDRYNLWHGSYMTQDKAAEEIKTVHLGIDVNAPAGTKVAPVHASRVAKIIHDPDQDGGWGSVIIFELKKPIGEITHYIYAHLGKDTIMAKIGDDVRAGKNVAALGGHHENGGWYEHLHVQAMTKEAWRLMEHRDDMGAFDGYDSVPEGVPHPLSPDPMPLLFK